MTKLSHELTFYSINVGTMRSDEQKKGLQAFIDTPLFQSGFTTKDFKAKLSWSNLGYRIYTLMGDFENAMQFGKAALGAWDTHPLFKQAQLQRYMGQLGNLLELCFALGRISEARQYMEILSNADADEPTKVLRKLSYASYFGMELLTAEKKFDELYSYCQEVAPKLENAGTKMGLHHLLWNYFRLTASYLSLIHI